LSARGAPITFEAKKAESPKERCLRFCGPHEQFSVPSRSEKGERTETQQDSASLAPSLFTISQPMGFLIVRTFERKTQETQTIDGGTNY
jgi:hypothetical protein